MNLNKGILESHKTNEGKIEGIEKNIFFISLYEESNDILQYFCPKTNYMSYDFLTKHETSKELFNKSGFKSKCQIYLFLHAKDFFEGRSQTHFEVDTADGYKELALTDYKEHIKILWFKREDRACTVYGPLSRAKTQYGKDEDSYKFKNALIKIYEKHDITLREIKRNNLIEFFLGEKKEIIDTDEYKKLEI